jgi:cell shape-determining protein MreC
MLQSVPKKKETTESPETTIFDWVSLFQGITEVLSVYTQEFLQETQQIQALLNENDQALTPEQCQKLETQLSQILVALSNIKILL